MNNDMNITLNEQKISIENEIEQENKNILKNSKTSSPKQP